MVRTVKEPSVRRNEIIDVAQKLVYTKGYEQMTIQDILDDLQISKGAFYHYFDSKGALLEALIERMAQEAEPVIMPIVEDPHLPVIQKLQRFFDASARWKTARKTYLLELLRVWYADENAIVRIKIQDHYLKYYAPVIGKVVRQGVDEGILTTKYPEQVGEVFLSVLLSLGDVFARLLFSPDAAANNLQTISNLIAAYNDALERVLGAPPGSLELIDDAILAEWFPQEDANPAQIEEFAS